jgi:hypothetical protein
MAFQPHFFAVAAAFVTAASERRLVSAVEDFPDEDVEFSRLGSCPNPNVDDLVDGASDLNDAVLILAGLGGWELGTGLVVTSETLRDG